MEARPTSGTPTVLIVDDDPAIRRSLATLVETLHVQARAFASAEEFLEAYDSANPGCVLLDVRIPGASGLELLERLVGDEARLPVVVLTGYGDVPTAVRAMRLGALNFLEKPYRDQQLWEAIQEALRWDAANRSRLAHAEEIRQRMARLTAGERDVLDYLVQGNSNKAIAARLGLSVRAVEVRRAKVMQKMGADSLAEVVLMVFDLGDVPRS
jgi:two-component system response regulator FixJ